MNWRLVDEYLEAEVGQGDAVLLSRPVHEQRHGVHAGRHKLVYNIGSRERLIPPRASQSMSSQTRLHHGTHKDAAVAKHLDHPFTC